MSFLHTMSGPDFLGLYFLWLLVTWIGMLIVRHRVADTWGTTVGGLFLFEGLGAARYFVGSAHGMHKWEFMFLMMVVGFFFFVLRAHNFSNGSGSGWSSCGGGGCGGGGGGGGGRGGWGGGKRGKKGGGNPRERPSWGAPHHPEA